MSKQKITSQPGPFTSIPLIYDDAKLTVYEHRLLCHYQRLGDGYEALRTTAKRCHMSQTSVIKARNGLEERGWITTGENDKGTIQVEVVDVWMLDTAIYGGAIKRPHEWVARFDSAPDMEQAVLQISSAAAPILESSRSINGDKEDPIRKIPSGREGAAKKRRTSSHPKSVQLFRAIAHRNIPKKMHARIDRAVGSEFGDLLTWGRTIRFWMMSGYKITNYAGMLDVFEQRKGSNGPPQIGKFLDDPH